MRPRSPSLSLGGAYLAGAFLVMCLVTHGQARAAAPEVDDKGGFFSDSALQQANQIVERIYRGTTPHKDVIVETVARLPAGSQADAMAEERFRRRDSDGVMIFLVKNPRKLVVTVGRATQDRFGRSEAEQMRRIMLDRFKQKDLDGGLLSGLRYAEKELSSSFPAVPATTRSPGYVPSYGSRFDSRPAPIPRSAPPYIEPRHGGMGLFGVLISLLLIGFVIWLGVKILRAIFGGISTPRGPGIINSGGGYVSPQTYDGGYVPQSGGGSFLKGVAGGVLGGVAGGYIYDKLAHSEDRDRYDRDDRYDGGYTAPVAEPSAPPSDEGQVGFSVGGSGSGDDWGGSGGGDSGGGGFDSGGGGDSSGGGGDW